MLEAPAAPHTAQYAVKDQSALTRALRNLPEFTRGKPRVDAEEFVWVVPQNRRGLVVHEPVATVRVGSGTLTVECHSRHALRAMLVLIESLVGAHLEPTAAGN